MSEAEWTKVAQRRLLELARARAADDLTRATAPAHRKMLEQALAAIETQLQQVR